MSENNTSCSPSTCSKNRTRTTNNTTFASAQSHISDETSYYSQIDPSRNTSQQNSTYGSALSKTFGCDPCDLNAPAPLANQTVPRPRSPLLGRRSPSPPRRAPANATFASRARTNVTFDTNQCPCDSLDGSAGAEAYNQTFARPPAHGANRTAGTSFTIQRRNSPNTSSGFEPSDGSAEETYDSSGEPSYASHVSGRLNQTCPGAQRVTGRPGRHSLPAGQVLGRSRDYPTDESFEENFNPPHASTWDSFPSMEDSSEMPLLGFGPINRSDEGKYNIILPMSPSPTKAPAPSSSGEAVSARSSTSGQGACPANQTYATNAPAAPVNRTFAAPAVNQTFAAAGECPCPTNQTYGPEGTFTDSTGMSSSGFDSSLPSTNQTYPRAQGRALRPGRHSHAAGQILGRSRDYATEESYEEKFNPKMASTWESFSSMEDSSLVPFLGCAGLRRSQEGIYNIIKPMSPSPTKAPAPSASGEAISARSSTSVQGVGPVNQTYAPPQVPANQTFAGPPVRPSVNQTFAPAGECPCPTNKTYGSEGTFDDSTGMSSSGFDSSLPSTNQTYPRAQGRALRPGRHSHAAGQILGRSRDYATEESYEERFNPKMASTWESFSSMEDSSLVPFLGCAGLRRSQEGIYNIIKPMSPSPTKAPAPSASGKAVSARSSTSVQGVGPANQTYAPPQVPANQTFAGPPVRPSVNQTFAPAVECPCPTNETYGPEGTFDDSTGMSSSGFDSSLPSTNQTYPRAQGRALRPGRHSHAAGQILGRSRDYATEESYEERFNPKMASTWESFSSMEDSSLVPFLGCAGLRRSQEGIYNIIKPMSPSPTKAPAPSASGKAVSARSSTSVQGVGPANQTYAPPQVPANQTFAGPPVRPSVNQTFAPAGECPCPTNETYGPEGTFDDSTGMSSSGFDSSLPSTNQTYPRAQGRALRPGRHSHAAGQILGRSRDYATEESYEEKFNPRMASTWESFSSMEDSSLVPFLGCAGLRRSQEGIYNIIKPMSPSPTKAPAPTAPSGTFVRGPTNQTYVAPGGGPANQTFTAPGGCPANQTFNAGESEHSSSFERSTRGELPSAGPLASFNRSYPGVRRPDTPRPGTRSLSAGQILCRSRTEPTDESYEENFNPVMASTWESFSSMEDSSLVPFLGGAGLRRSQEGIYNIIKPMSPSPTKAPAPTAPSGTFVRGPTNQTYAAPGGCPANLTFAAPGGRPANQTFSASAESSGMSSFSRSSRGQLPGAGFLESINQTCPGAQRTPVLRPGPHSVPAGQILGRSRSDPSDESYEEKFKPAMASTWQSFSSMEDSSRVPFVGGAGLRRSQEGIYNIIKPMSPSPTKAPAPCLGGEALASHGEGSGSYLPRKGNLPGAGLLESFNRTFPGVQRPASRSRHRSLPDGLGAPAGNQTFGVCPGACTEDSSMGGGIPPRGQLPGAGLLESFNQTHPGARRPPLHPPNQTYGGYPDITDSSGYSQSVSGAGRKLPGAGLLESFNQTFPGVQRPTARSGHRSLPGGLGAPAGNQTFGVCPGACTEDSSIGGVPPRGQLPGAGLLESFNQTHPGARRPPLHPPNQTYGGYPDITDSSSYSQSISGAGRKLPGAGKLESFNQTYPGAQRPALKSPRERSLPAGQGAYGPSCAIDSLSGSFRPPHASTWNSFSTLEESSWMPGQGTNPFNSCTGPSGSVNYSKSRHASARNLPGGGMLESFNQTYPGALRPAIQGGVDNCSCPPNLSAGASSFSHSSTGRGGRLPGAGMLESFNQTYPRAQRAPLRSRQEGSLPAGIGAFEPSSAVNSFTGSFRPPHASTWNSFSTLEESSWMPGQGTNPFNSCTGPSGSVNYSRSRHASARNLPGGGMLESFNQTYPGALRPALQGGVDNCSCPPNLSAGATSFSHSSTGRGGGLPGAGMLESFNQTYPGAQRAPLRSRPEGSLPAGIGAFDPSSAVNSFTGSFRPPHASTWNSFSTLDDSSWMPGQGSNPFDTGTSSYNSQYSSMPRGGGSRGGRLEHAGYLDSFNQSYPGALRAPQMQGGNENCTC